MALLSEKIRIEKGEFSGDYFVVFAVKVAKDNRLYLHEIYQKKTEVIRRSRPGPSRKTVPPATLLPPLYTVYLKKLEDVNAEFGESNEARSENQEKQKMQI